jgi:hypothetical protein
VDLRKTFAGRWLLSMLLLFGAIVVMWGVFLLPLPPEADWIIALCLIVVLWLVIILRVHNPQGRSRPGRTDI